MRPDSVLISTFGRLEAEKGLETIIGLAEMALQQAPELEFAIGGAGSLAAGLARDAERLPNLKILADIDYAAAQCLRATSAAGLFPTRVIPGFIETFCVAALEYQALAVPVLAGAIGGVPEATPDDRSLVESNTPAAQWLARIEEVLANRTERSATAGGFAAKFTSAVSARRLVDLAGLAADRPDRGAPLKPASKALNSGMLNFKRTGASSCSRPTFITFDKTFSHDTRL